MPRVAHNCGLRHPRTLSSSGTPRALPSSISSSGTAGNAPRGSVFVLGETGIWGRGLARLCPANTESSSLADLIV